MKRSDLARAQQNLQEVSQIAQNSVEHMVVILENAFSAIATAEPALALEILTQLNTQRQDIQDVIAERKQNAEKYVKLLASKMPPVLEFDDENEENEDLN